MTDAPERIWTDDECHYETRNPCRRHAVEYVRADIYNNLETQFTEANKALEHIANLLLQQASDSLEKQMTDAPERIWAAIRTDYERRIHADLEAHITDDTHVKCNHCYGAWGEPNLCTCADNTRTTVESDAWWKNHLAASTVPPTTCAHPVWGQAADGVRVCAKCRLVEPPTSEGQQPVAWTNRLSEPTQFRPYETPEFDIPLYTRPLAQAVTEEMFEAAMCAANNAANNHTYVSEASIRAALKAAMGAEG